MRNNIVKNQNNQLPNEVAAVKFPFNPDAKSALSKERINEINQMCLRAEINNKSFNGIKVDENTLLIEVFGLQEVFEQISYMGSRTDFYYHIDEAFKLLMNERSDDRVNVLDNYQSLTAMFRVVEKQHEYINNKLHEINVLINDVNKLDSEMMKGGASC